MTDFILGWKGLAFWIVIFACRWAPPHRREFPSARIAILSCAYVAWFEPAFTLFCAVIGAILWLLRPTGVRLLFSLVVLLAASFALKYGAWTSSAAASIGIAIPSYAMPIGTSYFVFRMTLFIFDRYRGLIPPDGREGRWAFANYVFFVPAWAAGPIDSFNNRMQQLASAFDPHLVAAGIQRVFWGVFKKIVIVEGLAAVMFGQILTRVADGQTDLSTLPSLAPAAFVVLAFVVAYLDLSAYTDIAIGTALTLGIRLPENFQRPFAQRNISEFWRSWHISLSAWCRSVVYFPVFGFTKRPVIAMYATMLTMGLWHDFGWNWLVWGCYHGSALALYAVWDRFKRRRPSLRRLFDSPPVRVGGMISTFLFVALGYAFVATKSIDRAFEVFRAAPVGVVECVKSSTCSLGALRPSRFPAAP